MWYLFSSSAYNAWLWVDEKGNENSYGPKNSLILEKALINKESSVDIEACHRAYSVDIPTMEQTNTTTDVKRSVKREPSGNQLEIKTFVLKYFTQMLNFHPSIFLVKATPPY